MKKITEYYDLTTVVQYHVGCSRQLTKIGSFWSVFWTRTGPERLVGPFQKILAEDHMYYNPYAIESAFNKAMNLDTMAVVHFARSACK